MSEVTTGLVELLARGGALVLTGAGISTGSGIPDYRGPDGRHRDDRPMTIDRFLASDADQRAYWARSHIGWERFRRAAPNAAHHAVTQLERAGLLAGVITQNVDGLHVAAATTDVIELHGRLDEVVCLNCGELTGRDVLAQRLEARNRGFRDEVSADETAVRPDGDILLHPRDVARFAFVGCATCGGTLKPGVVMFGEQVPRERYARARGLVDEARSLVVLGSSLSVGSGYRIVLDAVRRGIPVAIVNRGRSRGDAHATVRIDEDLCDVLPAVAGVATRAVPSP